jgi:methylated-DNA-[protein]-cysteine S-methyltransferase
MPSELLLPTPIGAVLQVRAEDGAIVGSDFRPPSRRASRAPQDDVRVRDPLLREARDQINAYFRKRLRRFDLPLALHGTPFQIAVWRLVASLEAGELISYGDVAAAIGAPLAHRGVAAAMRKTPYDLLIPAHRVIGADGRIKGSGANSLRRRLLAFEGIKLR